MYMIDWKRHFDHIYCIHYAGYPERLPRISAELQRVGILDSGIFSFYNTISSPLIEKFYTQINFHPRYNDFWAKNGYKNVELGHYQVLIDALLSKYNRILVLEEDVCFLKDIQYIQCILENTPNANLVLYDYFEYYVNDIDHSISKLGEFTQVMKGTYHSSAMYSMDKTYIKLYTTILEKDFYSIDDLWNHIDHTKMSMYISNVPCTVQKSYSNCISASDELIQRVYDAEKIDMSLYSMH